MILDEPTASFSQKEIRHLLSLLKKLSKEGLSIIYISHHLEEVFEIADRVTVIRDGEKVNTYFVEELTEEKLIADMVGRDVQSFYEKEEVDKGKVEFAAENISGNGVKSASLYVRKGECLGISGMVGSGRTELMELLFGAKRPETGKIFIRDEEVTINSPLDAINNRMCFITENRQESGLFLGHELTKNTVIASYSKSKSIFAWPGEEVRITRDYIKKLKIVTPSEKQKAVFLSGGNQQKIVLAKWFATEADIYIFDEPTRGIDVGAKEEIYHLMTALLAEGKAIIMVSSDMPELIAMSDRVMVMRDGEMVAELRDNITEERILTYSIGGTH